MEIALLVLGGVRALPRRLYHTLDHGGRVLKECTDQRLIVHMLFQSHEKTPGVLGHLLDITKPGPLNCASFDRTLPEDSHIVSVRRGPAVYWLVCPMTHRPFHSTLKSAVQGSLSQCRSRRSHMVLQETILADSYFCNVVIAAANDGIASMRAFCSFVRHRLPR